MNEAATTVGNQAAPKTKYAVTDETARRINNNFTYHPPQGDQTDRYEWLRARARQFALDIAAYTPPGREQALALTSLEETLMWSNAAIARGES